MSWQPSSRCSGRLSRSVDLPICSLARDLTLLHPCLDQARLLRLRLLQHRLKYRCHREQELPHRCSAQVKRRRRRSKSLLLSRSQASSPVSSLIQEHLQRPPIRVKKQTNTQRLSNRATSTLRWSSIYPSISHHLDLSSRSKSLNKPHDCHPKALANPKRPKIKLRFLP